MKNAKIENKKINKAANLRRVGSGQVRLVAKAGIKLRSGVRAGDLLVFPDTY